MGSIEAYRAKQAQIQVQKAQVEQTEPSKIQRVVSATGDFTKGMVSCSFFRATCVSGIGVGVVFAVYLALHMFPPVWMITAAAVGAFVLGMALNLLEKDPLEKMKFEVATVGRLLPLEDDYVKIPIQGGKFIILGKNPNNLTGAAADDLIHNQNVKAVLSVIESWENQPRGLHIPCPWKELGIKHKLIDVKDHTPLADAQLNEAVQFLNEQISALKQGEAVYVHCAAGHGRSAMAIAAYLKQFEQADKSFQEIGQRIKDLRPKSTILKEKKQNRLEDWHATQEPKRLLNQWKEIHQKVAIEVTQGIHESLSVEKGELEKQLEKLDRNKMLDALLSEKEYVVIKEKDKSTIYLKYQGKIRDKLYSPTLETRLGSNHYRYLGAMTFGAPQNQH